MTGIHKFIHLLADAGLWIEFSEDNSLVVCGIEGLTPDSEGQRLVSEAQKLKDALLVALHAECPRCYRPVTLKDGYWQCEADIIHFAVLDRSNHANGTVTQGSDSQQASD